jgi:hypothetical protein
MVCEMEEAVRTRLVAVLVICLIVAITTLAWYQSLPRPHGGSTTYWVEYLLTKNGNHTQIQASYSNGVVTTEQIL